MNDYIHAKIDYGKNMFDEIFDFKEIDIALEDHIKFKKENPNLLWNLASFFAWHEEYFK